MKGRDVMHAIKLHWLTLGEFISSLGMSFVWPLTSVYLHNQLHISLTVIGLVLMANSLASVLGSYFGGREYDRGDPYKLLLLGVGGAFLSMAFMALWHGWPIFPILLAAIGFCSGWNLALINAIGTSIVSVNSSKVFNNLYLAQNLGVVIGSALVGFLYGFGIGLLFLTATILFFIFFILVITRFKGLQKTTKHPATPVTADQIATTKHLPHPNFIVISVLFFGLFAVWTMYQQWVSNVSVFMTNLGLPLTDYSLLWTINASGIVLIQFLLNWIGPEKIKSQAKIIFGICMLGLSFVILKSAHAYPIFVLAMLTLTVGEAVAFPAIPALVNQLTPRAVKGRYQGMLNSWASAGRALGPLFGGMMIDQFSYHSLFIFAAVTDFVVAAIITGVLFVQRLRLRFFK